MTEYTVSNCGCCLRPCCDIPPSTERLYWRLSFTPYDEETETYGIDYIFRGFLDYYPTSESEEFQGGTWRGTLDFYASSSTRNPPTGIGGAFIEVGCGKYWPPPLTNNTYNAWFMKYSLTIDGDEKSGVVPCAGPDFCTFPNCAYVLGVANPDIIYANGVTGDFSEDEIMLTCCDRVYPKTLYLNGETIYTLENTVESPIPGPFTAELTYVEDISDIEYLFDEDPEDGYPQAWQNGLKINRYLDMWHAQINDSLSIILSHNPISNNPGEFWLSLYIAGNITTYGPSNYHIKLGESPLDRYYKPATEFDVGHFNFFGYLTPSEVTYYQNLINSVSLCADGVGYFATGQVYTGSFTEYVSTAYGAILWTITD